jgi:hydrogenase nickel incorporation protein HypB
VLLKNDEQARRNRERFRAAGLLTVNVLSSPGSGKTALLERTVSDLPGCAVIVGDLATDNDARRLRKPGVEVAQITTGNVCHLEAAMIERAAAGLDLAGRRLLFLENVGNLVCPSSYDLGEHLRLVLLSTTEGEDKPLKYPTIFNTADVAVITKSDLAAAAAFDREAAVRNIEQVRPGMAVLEVSSRTGEGFTDWLGLLARASRAAGMTAMPDPVLQHSMDAPALPPSWGCAQASAGAAHAL